MNLRTLSQPPHPEVIHGIGSGKIFGESKALYVSLRQIVIVHRAGNIAPSRSVQCQFESSRNRKQGIGPGVVVETVRIDAGEDEGVIGIVIDCRFANAVQIEQPGFAVETVKGIGHILIGCWACRRIIRAAGKRCRDRNE